jgi:hypothetical protein
MGVYQFQKDLIDAVIEKAMVRKNLTMKGAWGRFGRRMITAVKKLLDSSPPSLPVMPLLDEELTALYDDDQDSVEGEDASYTVRDAGAMSPVTQASGLTPAITKVASSEDLATTMAPASPSPSASGSQAPPSTLAHVPLIRAAIPQPASSPKPPPQTDDFIPHTPTPPATPLFPTAGKSVPNDEGSYTIPDVSNIANIYDFESQLFVTSPAKNDLIPHTPTPPATPLFPAAGKSVPHDEGSYAIPDASNDATIYDFGPQLFVTSPAKNDFIPHTPTSPATPLFPAVGKFVPNDEGLYTIPNASTIATIYDFRPPLFVTSPAKSLAPHPQSEPGPSSVSESTGESGSESCSSDKLNAPASGTDKVAPTGAKVKPGQHVRFLCAEDLLRPDSEKLTDLDESEASLQAPPPNTSSPGKTFREKGKGKAVNNAGPQRAAGSASAKTRASTKHRAVKTGQRTKHERSSSMESEDKVTLASSSRHEACKSKPVRKRQRVQSPSVAPMIAAFSENPIVEGLGALKDDQLLEPRGSIMGRAATDVPTLGERQVMEVQLPTAVYDKELDEVTFENRPFNFPYRVKV